MFNHTIHKSDFKKVMFIIMYYGCFVYLIENRKFKTHLTCKSPNDLVGNDGLFVVSGFVFHGSGFKINLPPYFGQGAHDGDLYDNVCLRVNLLHKLRSI